MNINVLIIEDEEEIRNQLEEAICKFNDSLTIIMAACASEALLLLNKLQMDIFLLDIGLPDMNGIELAIKIREMYPISPIIIVSGSNTIKVREKAHKTIQNLAFIGKPFTEEDLEKNMKIAILHVKNNYTKNLMFKTKIHYNQVVPVDQVIYIEKMKGVKKIKMALYNPISRKVTLQEVDRMSLAKIISMLEGDNTLIRCHRSFLVNKHQIREVTDTYLKIEYNNIKIPLGVTYQHNISEWMKGLGGE